MTSDSPSVPSSATRILSGPEYQTRSVREPESRRVRSVLALPHVDVGQLGQAQVGVGARRCRRGRRACGLQVDQQLGGTAFGGSDGSADAAIERAAAPPPTTTTVTATGTSQRSAGRVAKIDMTTMVPPSATERSLRVRSGLRFRVPRWWRAVAGGGGRAAAGPGAATRAGRGGVRGRRRPRRAERARAGPARRLRRDDPRRDAARPVRLPGGAAAAGRGAVAAGADALRQGRRVRPGRRPRLRRRRLPDQAVLVRGAAGPAAGAAAAGRAVAARRCSPSATSSSTRRRGR